MPRLFHVTDAGPLARMTPRPSPPGTAYEGRPWVWALDQAHLPHYLLPRQCPRVCWKASGLRHPLLGSASHRVIAIERRWAHQLLHAGLDVHELEPAGFTLIDEQAGYWVADREVPVINVRHVEDCFDALNGHDVELRLVPSLWPFMDAVIEHAPEYSGIRLRNASARPA